MPTTRRGYRGWTNEELIQLYEQYPQGGCKAVMSVTGRSYSSVMCAARRHRLFKTLRKKWRHLKSTAPIDRAIEAAYSSGRTGAVKDLAQRIGRPYEWVRHRALALGCRPQRLRDSRWTPEEDAMLAEMAGYSLVTIVKKFKAAGYHRTQVAVHKRLNQKEIDTHDPDIFTASGLSKLMGLSHHAVTRWISKGWLPARREKRLSVHPGDPQNYWIHRRELREFMIAYPLVWDHRKVRDTPWLVEMLSGRVGPRAGNRVSVSGESDDE